jgi:hypothetical protein
MIPVKDAKLTFVTGRRGSGKSTLTKRLIHGRPRVVVFDPRDEYASEARMHRVHSFRGLVDEMSAGWPAFTVAYVPPAGREAEALHGVCSILWAVQAPYEVGRDRQKLTLVVEEMDLSFPSRALPAELNGMMRTVNQGRHAGIEVMGVSQRPALVSATFRGNCAATYVFPLSFADDRTEILRLIGREHEAALTALAPHSYIYIEDGKVSLGKNPSLR